MDAFNKPFMVGGLKRSDGTVRPASDLTASKGVSTTERVNAQGGSSTGNGSMIPQGEESGATDAGPVGSPDWPSDVEYEDGDEDGRPVARGREKVPSRSPPPESSTEEPSEVWRDPLEEDEDEEAAPPPKRRRES